MRTFIAIDLGKDIQQTLGRLQSRLCASGADVKWVKPANIHLTLKFLGEIDSSTVEQIKSILDQVARRHSNFKMVISDLGAFPKIDYPRVIWVGIQEGKVAVLKIAQEVEQRLERIGLAAEKRPFSAHITIGRVRRSINRNRLVELIKQTEQIPQQSCIVKKLTLYKSTLTGSGPIYEVISLAELSQTN